MYQANRRGAQVLVEPATLRVIVIGK